MLVLIITTCYEKPTSFLSFHPRIKTLPQMAVMANIPLNISTGVISYNQRETNPINSSNHQENN